MTKSKIKEFLQNFLAEHSGFFKESASWFFVTPEEYEKVKAINELPTDLIKKLDLNQLSNPEITYLSCVNLVEPVYGCMPEHGGKTPIGWIWTNNERKPFDMSVVKLYPEKFEGDTVTFDFPPRSSNPLPSDNP